MEFLFRLWHWVIHKFNLNYDGRVISWHDKGHVFVAFQCKCGYLDKSTVTCTDKLIDNDIFEQYKELDDE